MPEAITSISEAKRQLRALSDYQHIAATDPRVRALVREIIDGNKPAIDSLEELIADLQGKKKAPRRFPDGVPTRVMETCLRYWNGTVEFRSFRIHCWNDYAVWTSYPGGTWSDNMGVHRGTSHYYLIPLIEYEASGVNTRLGGRKIIADSGFRAGMAKYIREELTKRFPDSKVYPERK